MTAIAVRKYKDKIVISADTQTTHGDNKKTGIEKEKMFHNTKKINKIGDVIVGGAGRVKKIRYFARFLETHKVKDNSFNGVDNLMMDFEEWCKTRDPKGDEEGSVHLILIIGGKIFLYTENGFLQEINEYGAIGSGMYLCIGAMYHGGTPEKAIEAAKEFDLYCGGETQTIEIPLTNSDEKK